MKKIIIIILVLVLLTLVMGLIFHSNLIIIENVANPEIALTENKENEVENEIMTIEVEEEKWEWQIDLPENHNINKNVLETLHRQLDSYPINSSVIVKDGVIVDEYYKQGYNEESVFTLQSCSKSVTSALIGIAIDKGYIESVNTPISNYFPQILESNNQYLKEITIWHVLTHTTGLNSSDTANWTEWLQSSNWVDYVLNRPSIAKPGTTFSYFTGNTHLLSAILQQATGKTAYEFGKEYLFDPLDMESVECKVDPQGISDGGNGFAMNVYDMAKFGELFLNKGKWNDEQIISEQWITDSTSLQFDRQSGSADYGYQWWVRTFGEKQYKAYFAQGHGGQYIFVVPELELVVVFTSNYTGSTSIYWQYVNDIVNACN